MAARLDMQHMEIAPLFRFENDGRTVVHAIEPRDLDHPRSTAKGRLAFLQGRLCAALALSACTMGLGCGSSDPVPSLLYSPTPDATNSDAVAPGRDADARWETSSESAVDGADAPARDADSRAAETAAEGGPAVGDATRSTVCRDHAECSPGDTCFRVAGAIEGRCRPLCRPDTAGQTSTCTPDAVCVGDVDRSRAACLQRCDPYAANTCESGDGCQPNPDPSVTGGTSIAGVCVRAGTLSRGASCASAACGSGLDCYRPSFGILGPAHCEPVCEPQATSGPGTCAAGERCRPLSDRRGVCVRTCNPQGTNTCPGSQVCTTVVDASATTDVVGEAIVEGHCVEPGTKTAGQTCEDGECAGTLVCGGVRSEFAPTQRVCTSVCQVGSPTPGCATGVCAPVFGLVGEVKDDPRRNLGTCQLGCAVLTGTSCSGWCAPSSFESSVGVCADKGAGQTAAPCTYASDCGGGSTCDCRFGTDGSACGLAEKARCEQICIPGATTGAPGSCPGTQVCARKANGGQLLSYGICRQRCDRATGGKCTDSDETCVAGALVSADHDACVDVHLPLAAALAPCGPPDTGLFEPCGPMSACVQSGDSGARVPQCHPICRISAGALGTTNHPDCPTPSAVCTLVQAGLTFGYCH